jgi:hypothetical protein
MYRKYFQRARRNLNIFCRLLTLTMASKMKNLRVQRTMQLSSELFSKAPRCSSQFHGLHFVCFAILMIFEQHCHHECDATLVAISLE